MSRKSSINEWLYEYRNVDTIASTQLNNYSKKILERNDLIEDIFTSLEDDTFHETYLEKICDQLYKYYRKKDYNLKIFTFTYIPTLIGIHLRNCNRSTIDKLYHTVDIFLLGIYNLEINDDEGDTIKRTFRLPNLNKPSIYHEPYTVITQPSSILTENLLHRLETGATDVIIPSFGPYSDYDNINSGDRMTIITVLMKVYNQFISSLPKISHTSLCQMAISILNNENKEGNHENQKYDTDDKVTKWSIDYSKLISKFHSKITINSTFLIELLHSIYFCIYNDCPILGYQALEAIHKRAVTSLYSDVLLMSLAIKSSIKSHPSGQIIDGSMGITLTLSPTSVNNKNSHLSKAILTNASFRTKKLPDDIPIISSPTTSASASGSQLISINEDINNENIEIKIIINDKEKPQNAVNKQNPVLNLLKDRKEKRKDSKTSNNSKHNSNSSISKLLISHKDVPEVIYRSGNNILDSNDIADIESDTSGISETKSDNYSSDHEGISLVQFPPTIKSITNSNNNNNSNNSNGLINDDYSKTAISDGANIPLIKRNENNKHESIKV